MPTGYHRSLSIPLLLSYVHLVFNEGKWNFRRANGFLMPLLFRLGSNITLLASAYSCYADESLSVCVALATLAKTLPAPPCCSHQPRCCCCCPGVVLPIQLNSLPQPGPSDKKLTLQTYFCTYFASFSASSFLLLVFFYFLAEQPTNSSVSGNNDNNKNNSGNSNSRKRAASYSIKSSTQYPVTNFWWCWGPFL